MATLTLNIENDTVFNNLKNVLKLIKGVTIVPTMKEDKASSYDKKSVDISGIGGAWASEDFPTSEELHAMRRSNHQIPEL